MQYSAVLALQGPNAMTQCLMRTVNESGKLHMTPALLNETYIMRWCACAEWLADDDVFVAWNVIQAAADDIIRTRNKLLRVVSLGKSRSRELSRSIRQHSTDTFLCSCNQFIIRLRNSNSHVVVVHRCGGRRRSGFSGNRERRAGHVSGTRRRSGTGRLRGRSRSAACGRAHEAHSAAATKCPEIAPSVPLSAQVDEPVRPSRRVLESGPGPERRRGRPDAVAGGGAGSGTDAE